MPMGTQQAAKVLQMYDLALQVEWLLLKQMMSAGVHLVARFLLTLPICVWALPIL